MRPRQIMNLATGVRRDGPRLRNRTDDWYRIVAHADLGTTEIYLYDEIGFWGTSAAEFVDQVRTITTPTISLHLNTPGGEIFDGIAIYNVLRAHGAQVRVTVDALAASIGSVIAMAGDEILMAPHSQMMIHDGLALCLGNASDMRSCAELLDRQSDNIAAVYADRAGGAAGAWRERMLAETWYSAAEAVEAGLADRVIGDDEPDPIAPISGDVPTNRRTWDLSFFQHAGRADAPAPVPVPREEPEQSQAVVEPPLFNWADLIRESVKGM